MRVTRPQYKKLIRSGWGEMRRSTQERSFEKSIGKGNGFTPWLHATITANMRNGLATEPSWIALIYVCNPSRLNDDNSHFWNVKTLWERKILVIAGKVEEEMARLETALRLGWRP